MRRKIRGIFAAALAAAVLAGTCGGCGNKKEQQDAGVTDSPRTQTTQENDSVNDSIADPEYNPAAEGLEYAGPPASMQENEGTDTTSAQSADTALGRYMEQEMSVPDGLVMFYAWNSLDDGTLRILGYNGTEDGVCVWDSHDSGASWEKKYALNEMLGVDATSCTSGAVAADGNLFLCLSNPFADEDAPGEGYIYGKISPDGVWQQTELALPQAASDPAVSGLDRYLYKIVYAEQGKILTKLLSGSDKIYLFDDTTGELLAAYNEEDHYISFFEKAGESVYAFGMDHVTVYDYATGEEKTEEALTEEMESDPGNLELQSSAFFPTVMCGGRREGEVYYAMDQGIYRYASGGNMVEQVVDGSLNSISKPSVGLFSLLALEDGSLMLAVQDGVDAKLFHYVYDASAPTVPDTELKIYSLEENRQIQQTISMFQARNPHYYVTYETGMSGTDAVTASDALRTLNTEIMAGNGPDILVLDGMPTESYIQRGILQDISDVVREVKETDGLFENITDAYETDGRLYAVPSRFKVPVLVANEDILSGITDLTSLGETARKLREEDPDSKQIVGFSDIYWTVKTYYEACSAGLLDEDGSLDADRLKNFVEQLKALLELNQYSDEEAQRVHVTTLQEGEKGYDFTSVISMFNFLQGAQKIEQVNLAGVYFLQDLASAAGLTDQLSYAPSAFFGANVFVPEVVVGISSQSGETEGAKEFVRFLLSKDAQASNLNVAFPVNRAGFTEEISAEPAESIASVNTVYEEDDGTIREISYDVKGLANEEKERFLDIVEKLDTPALTDAVIEELVISQTAECLAGHITVEDALNAINQKMNLYLQE